MALTFAETLPGPIQALQYAPGSAPGPGGSGGAASPAPGAGWEVVVRSYRDYSTLLALLPPKVIQQFSFTKQLSDIGSGVVQLNLDDPWWHLATLGDGSTTNTILDFECLWQFVHDGVVRFEFLGETVQEQLVDSSEQRIVSVTGPGTAAALKWAVAAPPGFPDIVLKLDAIADSFSGIDVSGNPVLDTNIWNVVSPAGSAAPIPVAPAYFSTRGTGINNQLFPSGTLTLTATSGTSVLGATPYDATDTLISAQVTPIGAANIPTDSNGNAQGYGSNLNGTELSQFYVQSLKNSSYYAMIGLSATSFYCQLRGPSGTFTHVICTAASFDPSKFQYWMITERGGAGGGSGTFYFWVSADGQNWTLEWQVVHNWDATYCGFYVAATYTGSGQGVILTNLNSNVAAPSYAGNIFLQSPAMGIWYDLLLTAQARGTIPFVTTTLTLNADSYGRPWTDVQNVQVTNGTDLLGLLQSFTATVNADFLMQPGFQLQVGLTAQNSISLGIDRSGSVVFREGRDQAAKTRTRARNQIINLVGAENNDGHEISSTDPASVTQWGQREGWFQTAAQVDPVSMQIAAAAAAADAADEVLSWTLTIPPDLPGRTVFSNFDCGDWVGLERPDFSAVDAVRVVAIAVSVDSSGLETNELTISSYMQWLEQQLTYLANKLGGAFVNAQGTTPVAPSRFGTQVPTYFTPAQSLGNLADVVGTAGHHASPLVYNAATGQWQPAGTASPASGSGMPLTVPGTGGTVTVNNGSVTTSAAPTPVAAPDGGGLPAVAANTVTAPTVTTITDATGTVRTVLGVQPDGAFTHADFNGPAPGAADTPAVTGTLGGILVTWDGLIGGTAPLSDFLWAEVHVSVSSGFTPSAATLKGTLVSAAVFPVTGLGVGITYYVKLVARNTSGVAGTPSAQASGVPTSLTASLAGQLGVLNANPYFAGGDGTGWNGASGTFSVSSSPPSGSPFPYAGQFTVGTSGVNAAAKESGQPFRVTDATQYLVTAWVYTPTTQATIGLDWQDSSHAFLSFSVQTFTVTANTWTLVTTVQISPGGAAWAFPRVAPADGVGNSIYFEAVLCLPQVPGALIQAGTITAAQIAANTITAAQIAAGTITAAQIASATITAAQIAAGTITASQIAAGTITAGLLAAGIVKAGIIDGTSVSAQTYLCTGAVGQFLAYTGTPVLGNLDTAIAGAAGADGAGNSWGRGLTSFGPSGSATQINGGLVGVYSGLALLAGLNSLGLLVYNSSGAGAGNLINSIASAAGTDSSGNPFPEGLFSQQLTLANQVSAPPSFSGASVLFSSIVGRLRYLSSAGDNSVLDRSIVNGSQFTVPNTTTPTIISAPLNYLVNEGTQSSEYEIEIDGIITAAGSGTAQTLTFQLALDGSAPGGSGPVTLGAVFLAVGATYSYTIRFRWLIVTSGASGTANLAVDGQVSKQAANVGSSTTPVPTAPLGQVGIGKSFDTTVAHTLQAYAYWGGTQSGQGLTTYRTRVSRRN